ncbi:MULTISPECIES: ABC transporter ATP-binding protein [unclassified Achromobacter]|uniref:ABC transporter ATP-binding protein n=1 Tax=unclassified Achromobacter TaxID=2626865 RepID=UPI000B51DF83|nr:MULTISPECIES: dipeptide ABC transporter ATP-binding protein [unclassified Achromobacter]OWT73491.1 peptide ABC transporter ATP-binding protein [Achromobacter sp. HZ34]OWT79590.1 peptide ABC transporter ATP-binding protein [Achromobacter sp. HZ28]
MNRPLLEVKNLSKRFVVKQGFMGSKKAELHAVHDVSFSVAEGEAFGIVGESGCGKSTAGRSLLRLTEPSAGEVRYKGEDIVGFDADRLRALRREIQIIFQDPYASLNPRMTIGQTLAEPMLLHGIATRANVREKIEAALLEVGLPAQAAQKYPHEFSGGQRQRVGIARALSLNPKLIVADEPVSALDVSIQAQVLLLMEDLQRKRGLSFVFISHDLGVVRHFCDNVAVMYLGRIVEKGSVDTVFEQPLHPYTQALRAASPVPDPENRITVAKIEGDIASPLNPPTGCHFHPRCPKAMAVCKREYPAMRQAEGREVACHLYPAVAA